MVEPLDRLSKGGEVDKEIYVLRRLHAEDGASDSGLGLHFDLTVPFARYVLENSGKLEFPFRRYQIQPAWRGERPQEGRYRQFTQADIDVVGRDELPFHHDVEVVRVMVEALDALPLPNLSFQVNNRKLIQGFYRGLGIPDVTAAIRAIDKLDKQPADAVARLLVEDAGATPEQAAALPRPGHDPGRRHVLRGPGPRARGRGRAARDRAGRAGRGRSTAAPPPSTSTSPSRPTCGSPAGSTTTPARCSRSSWPATSGSSRSAAAAGTTRSRATAARRTPASA